MLTTNVLIGYRIAEEELQGDDGKNVVRAVINYIRRIRLIVYLDIMEIVMHSG